MGTLNTTETANEDLSFEMERTEQIQDIHSIVEDGIDLHTIEMELLRPLNEMLPGDHLDAARKLYDEAMRLKGKNDAAAVSQAEHCLEESLPETSNARSPQQDLVWELLGYLACQLANTSIPPCMSAKLDMRFHSSYAGAIDIHLELSEELDITLRANNEKTEAVLQGHKGEIIDRLGRIKIHLEKLRI